MTLYWRILQFGRRKKDHGSPTLCTFKDLSCSYGNLDLAASNSRNTRKFFSYSSAKFCLFQTFCIISSVLFPFKLLLVSLPTLPPNIQQVNIAWLMMWSTLHVSLYRKTLRITTMGDGRRGREKRGIWKCSVVFNASNKEKKPSKSFCSTKPKQKEELFNKIAWLTRNQLEKLQKLHKITKNV